MRSICLLAASFVNVLVFGGVALADVDCPNGSERREREGPERVIFCADRDARRQGPEIVFHPSGAKKSEGTYRDGKRHGFWKYWDEDGVLRADDEYRDGKRGARRRVGAAEVRPSVAGDPIHPCPDDAVVAGSPTSTQWCERDRGDGAYVLHGARLHWSGGVLSKREEFRNGIPHGDWIEWRDGRMVSHRQYANGVHHGVNQTWYENGNLQSRAEFEHGMNRHAAAWYENGSPRDEEWSDEAGDTVRRLFWHDNGEKRTEKNWAGRKREGIEREWWRNGKLKSEKRLHQGREVGESSRWNFAGQLIERSTFASDGTRKDERFAVIATDEPDWVPRPIARSPARAPDKPVVCPDGAEPTRRRVEVELARLFGASSEDLEQAPMLKWIDVEIGTLVHCSDPRNASVAEGPAAELYRDGRLISTGSYAQGRKQGLWISWGRNGYPIAESLWKDGQLERRVIWDESGQILSIKHYDAGKEHGVFATWYPNGARHVVGSTDHGENDGTWMWYDESGRRYKQAGYRRGRNHGEWIEWGDEGGVECVFHYHEGSLHGAYRTNLPDGSPREEGAYHEGKKHGPWTEWQEGKKWKVVHYDHGELQGPYARSWKGQLAIEGEYRQGRRVGKWTMYHRNGQRSAEGPYAWCAKPPFDQHFENLLPGTSPIDGSAGERDGCKQGLWTYWDRKGNVLGTFMHEEAGEASASPVPASASGDPSRAGSTRQ